MRIVILAATLIVSTTALPDDKPLHKHERSNYDFKKSSVAELKTVMDCLTDKTPCPPELKYFRQIYPTVVINACERCMESQKPNGYILFNRVMKELPQEFAEFKSKHDPEGKYFDRFLAALEKSYLEQRPHRH